MHSHAGALCLGSISLPHGWLVGVGRWFKVNRHLLHVLNALSHPEITSFSSAASQPSEKRLRYGTVPCRAPADPAFRRRLPSSAPECIYLSVFLSRELLDLGRPLIRMVDSRSLLLASVVMLKLQKPTWKDWPLEERHKHQRDKTGQTS